MEFTSDAQALIAGFVLGMLQEAGLPVESVMDGENHTPVIRLTLPHNPVFTQEYADLTITVPDGVADAAFAEQIARATGWKPEGE